MFTDQSYQYRFRRGVYDLMAEKQLKTLQDVAKILDMKYMALYKVMDETNNPTTELCIKLCQVAGYSANWLFLGEGSMHRKQQADLAEILKELRSMRRVVDKTKEAVVRKKANAGT